MTMRDRPDADTVFQLDRLLDEQDRRFALGERLLVEPLLEAQPELRRRTELVLDLIYHEIHLREQAGERPALADYRQRFPEFADALCVQFEVHLALGADSADAAGDPTAPAPRTGPAGAAPQAATPSRYRIVRPHARGGLGEVFVAEDCELQREVALKEIQRQFAADEASRTRFVMEAQTTGNLEHPGIVPVYGLGAYADGRPFYAMRFIKGTSLMEAITEYHATGATDPARPLRLRDLLRRLGDVCNAMQYAHDRGVIHRDLKPGNIMLGKYGETLVVDWGLAKLIGRTAEAAHSEEASLRVGGSGSSDTAAGAAIGTPAYMSPEQAAGQHHQVGRASDVYSLGATLYCLVTGRPPYQGATPDVLAKVPYGDFPPPRRIVPDIAAPLEAICLKAMAVRPPDRYGSPRQLGEDLERWLADEPVCAWPEPYTIRTARWLRRHRALVSSAAAALLVMMVGAIAASVLLANVNQQLDERNQALDTANAALRTTNDRLDATNRELSSTVEQLTLARREAEEKRHKAEEEQLIADAVRTFLQHDLLLQADPTEQADRLLVMGGERFATSDNPTINELLQRAAAELTPEKIDAKFPKQPLVQASILWTLGRTFNGVGDHEQAIAHLQRARALVAGKLGPDHPDTLTSMSDLALAYQAAGKPDFAVPLYQEALRKMSAKLGPDHRITLQSANNLVVTYLEAGKLNLALTLLQETVAKMQAKLGPDHRTTLAGMGNLASAYQAAGELDLAVTLFNETFQKHKAKLGLDHPWTLVCLNNLALAYLETGKPNLALPLYQDTLQRMKAKLGPDHPNTLTMMGNLALAYQNAGKLELSLSLFQETHARQTAKLGPDHPATLGTMNNLAQGYLVAGKRELALPLLKETVEKMQTKLGPDHPSTLTSVSNLAIAYQDDGKLALALPLLQQTLQMRKARRGPDHPDTLDSMNNLAMAYQAAGKSELALPLLQEALRKMKANRGPDHPNTLTSMNNLGYAYDRAGKPELALPLYQEALEKQRIKLGPDHPATLRTMNNLAAAYWRAGRLDQSVPLFEEVLRLREKKLGRAHPDTVLTVANLGVNYRNAGRLKEALPLLEEAYRASRSMPTLRWVTAELLNCYARAKQAAHAAALLRELLTDARMTLAKESPELARMLAGYGLALLHAGAFADAEPLLRECLAIRQRTQSEDWSTFNTQSMLGGALFGQKQYAAAEPLLLAGYDGMKQRESKIPPQARIRLTEAEGRLAELFEVTRTKEETRLQGSLTDVRPDAVHEVTLAAGTWVVVEMRSKQFDTLLQLEDEGGKRLAENDDIEPKAKDLNSRIVYRATADGVYRLIATSFQARGRGAYEIVVRQYRAAKHP
jgi:serine/threonine protein kinase